MNEMSILPVQLIRMIRTLEGICILLVPARSAPAYEHQLQQKAKMRGSKPSFFEDSFFGLGVPVDFGVKIDKDRASSDWSGDKNQCY